MKYADCPTVEVTVTIDATADAVWEVVSDIDLPSRFSSELSRAEWVAPHTEGALGASFTGYSAHEAIGEWSTTCVISRWEPRRVFEWTVVGAGGEASSIWRFSLETGDGGPLELTQWFQMGPGRSGLNAAIDRMPDKEERIVAKRLGEHRANMERTLAGIKQLLETPSGEATPS